MDCIFCKIVRREIQAKIITESTHSIAFLDAFPLARGHTLVVPKKHYSKLQDVSFEDNLDLFSLVHDLIPTVDKFTGATLLASHNGKDAGQEVPHVHIHLIPRNADDSAGPIHSMFSKRPKLSEKEFDDILLQMKV